MIEIIVHFENSKSSIVFDALPTFNTLRRAISQDITRSPNFLIIGSTQRGTPIAITDQTSFVRALGPRSSMILNVRPQADVSSGGHQQQQAQQHADVPKAAPTTPLQQHADPNKSTPSAAQQQRGYQAAHPVARGTNSNNNNNNANNAVVPFQPQNVSPSRNKKQVQTPSSPSQQYGAADGLGTVQQVVDAGGDARCCVFVPLPVPTVWAGERQTGSVRIHNYFTGNVEHVIRPSQNFSGPGPHAGCLCIAYVPSFSNRVGGGASPSGSVGVDSVWAGYNSKEIRVFDVERGKERAVLTEHTGAVVALESAGGGGVSMGDASSSFVFSASLDFTILQWNVDSMSVARMFSRHRNGVRSLAIVPVSPVDGSKLLISGSDDRCLVAWRADTGDVVAESIQSHGGGIHALAIDAEGRVWSGCEDGTVKVWQLLRLMEPQQPRGSGGGSIQQRFECVASFREHAASVAFIKCFRARAISSSHDGTICVYDAIELEPVGSMPHPHDAPALSIALSSLTTVFKFWTGSSDRRLCRWSLEDPGALLDDANNTAGSGAAALLANNQHQHQHHNNQHADQQNDAIALLRFTLDRTTEKTLIVAEEAKNRAELSLMFERRLRQKYFVPTQESATRFSSAAISVHQSYATSMFDAYVATCLSARSALERSQSALALAAAEVEHVAGQRDVTTRKATKQIESASTNISALNRRVSELESSLAFAREEVARTTAESRDCADREKKLSEAYDKSVERQQVLEVDLKKALEAKSTDAHSREKGQLLKDEKWRQQEFILQEQLANQRNQIEERDSQIRMLKLQLSSQETLAKSRGAEIDNIVKSANETQQSNVKTIAAEKEQWAARTRDLETKLDEAYQVANEHSGKQSAEINNLKAQLLDAQQSAEKARVDNDAMRRQREAKIAELEQTVATLQSSVDHARGGWQRESEGLSRDLQRTSDTLTRADDYAVNVERESALDRAAMKAMEQQNVQVTTDNAKLRETLLVEKSSAQSQVESLESALATLRREHAEAQSNFASEQAARMEVERRLASIERSYEELRKTVDEGAVAVSNAYDLDTAALARKYSELEAATNAAHAQLTDDIASLNSQLETMEQLKNEAQSDAMEKSNEASALATELRETKNKFAMTQSAYKREVDTLRLDIADLTHTCATERARCESEQERHDTEVSELKARLNDVTLSKRRLETDLAKSASDAAAATSRAQVTSEAESRLQLERSQLIEDITHLQAELSASDTRVQLTSKRLLDAEQALSNSHDERARVVASKQGLLNAQEDELIVLRQNLQRTEDVARSLEAKLAQSENDLRAREAKHATLVEEMRRVQRHGQLELESTVDSEAAKARTATERCVLAEDELARVTEEGRVARAEAGRVIKEKEALVMELERQLRDVEKHNKTLQHQLQTSEATISEWRDLATLVRSEADQSMSQHVAESNLRHNDMSAVAEARINRLEQAVAKGREFEQLLQERADAYKAESTRAREQSAILSRELEDVRSELQRVRAGEAVEAAGDGAMIRRLQAENDDLKRRLTDARLVRGAGGTLNSSNNNNNSSVQSEARQRQLEAENEVLHGRVASLDAERNSAWKELQQLLEDHRVLHRQLSELKQQQQHQHQQHDVVGRGGSSPSSEIAILRNGGMGPQIPSSDVAAISHGAATRGAALAAHYSELLAGVKDALSLVQRTGGAVDALSSEQLRKWLAAAAVRGEAVTSTLFTDDERHRYVFSRH